MNFRVFALVIAVSCLFLLTNTAYSQTPSPTTYFFVEVKDTSGEAVAGATVTVDGRLQGSTNEDGSAGVTSVGGYGPLRYELQVSKAGYLTSEHAVFAYCMQSHSIYTRDSLPDGPFEHKNCKEMPISVQLLRIPVTAVDRQRVETEEQKRQFLLAAKRGDAASLLKLLDAGIKPGTTDDGRVPAIVWAAYAGDPETIKALLERGAVVKNRNTLAHQVLLLYLSEGIGNDRRLGQDQAAAVQQREEVVRRLVEAGAGVNIKGSHRGTVLNLAIHRSPYANNLDPARYYLPFESVKLLIKAGADVNAPDLSGSTPLMSAAEKMSPILIKMLFEAGARTSINAKDNKGQTALMFAAQRGDAETIKTLLEAGVIIDTKDNLGQTALMFARGHGSSGISSLSAGKSLIAAGANVNEANAEKQTLLMLVVQHNYADEVAMFLEAGARTSINARDSQGRTALMYVRSQSYRDESTRIIGLLLEAGADVNVADNDGQTPLMLLSTQELAGNAIPALLEGGANVSINVQDKQGRTALMLAAQAGSVQRIKDLREAGASINARDNKGQTALTYAALGYPGRFDIISFLVSAGLRVDDENDEGQTPLMLAAQRPHSGAVSQLLKAGGNSSVNKKDKLGRTALMHAVSLAGYIPQVPEAVSALLEAGADVNGADESGQTVLMFATRGSPPQVINKLLQDGARINAQDKQGLTALMYAIGCECGTELELAKLSSLLAGGAAVSIKDNQGRTALMLAKQRNVKPIITLLEEAQK